ncbi:MAG TPA: ATP-binding protein [Bacteroidia bacterium]|nr:ATP-binding protein [Bacteroidia bacterium]
MQHYTQKQTFKWILAIVAIFIMAISLYFSNQLVKNISIDERKKIQLWANAVQKRARLVKITSELFDALKQEERKKAELYAQATQQLLRAAPEDIPFILDVLKNNTTVPVILTDEHSKVTAFRNIDSNLMLRKESVDSILSLMKKNSEPLVFKVYGNKKNFLYYKDSKLLENIHLVFDSIIHSFINDVVTNSLNVPVIYVNETKDKIIASGNIDTSMINTPKKLQEQIKKLAAQNPAVEIDLGNNQKGYIFYAESPVITKLRYYPYIQWIIISVFVLFSYILFSWARKTEQDLIWVGLSKETAHQLGTPISALSAWLDVLKSEHPDNVILNEIEKDIQRLNIISERFSKIGSTPELSKQSIHQIIEGIIDYLQSRLSKNIEIQFIPFNEELFSNVSKTLIEWVLENVIKNSVDAMDGKGLIVIKTGKLSNHQIYIDIIDKGKGIPKNLFKTIFKPGFSTKKRGWGLGLSLSKRIIEEYHKGKIFVHYSEQSKGTCIRIILPESE